MRQLLVLLCLIGALAACGQSAPPQGNRSAPGNAATAQNSTTPTNEADATADSNTTDEADAVSETPDNPALGRWKATSKDCKEIVDIEFTADGVRLQSPDRMPQVMLANYSDLTPNSVRVDVAENGKRVLATLIDDVHLTLTTPDKPGETCLLERVDAQP